VAMYQAWHSMGWDPSTGNPCFCDHPGGGHRQDRTSALKCTAKLRKGCPEYDWLTIFWLPDNIQDMREYIAQAREDTNEYFAQKNKIGSRT
jgi:hypothetical protein